ncbi:MAG: mevalonate kinase [Anaerolineae bacterium]|nr:mevalonate kinase [Anaerolineae bacterium]MCI0608170.1 mevalonate kinase [Anaerolineae bacterium]
MTTASAPGKIILFGEHAVVYGRPALAVPVIQVHADVEVLDSPRAGIWINAPDISLHAELNTLPSDHPIAAVIHNFLFLIRTSPSLTRAERSASEDEAGRGVRGEGGFPNLNIKITSTIPVASGLGSGAAVTVALTRALSSHLNHSMTDNADAVSAFTYEIEKLYHGTPSGIDNTVITYAKPVYFMKRPPSPSRRGAGGEVETFKVGKPFTIVIGDTGIPAPTKESVADVRQLWMKDTKRFEVIFDEVADISFSARRVIEEGWVEMLGTLMDENHALLQEMTVSSPELDQLVSTARNAGALGAKLSGGGRGGNMIALVNPERAEEVASALITAGAKRTLITTVS